MIHDLLIFVIALALMGSGAWLMLAGTISALHPGTLVLGRMRVPALSNFQLQLLCLAVVVVGFALYLTGSYFSTLLI